MGNRPGLISPLYKDGPLPVDRQPSLATAWATVALLSVLYFFAYLDRLIFSLLIGPIKSEFGVSDTQLGLLVGASFAVFYVVFALPMSRIADRSDRRRLIILAALVWNGMTAASAFAHDFNTLVLMRIGVALGEAALVPAAMSMMADLFDREHRAGPTSVFVGAGTIGTTGALVIGAAAIQLVSAPWVSSIPWIGQLGPWRLTLLFIGVPGLVLALLFGLLAREPRRTFEGAVARASIGDVVKHMLANAAAYGAVMSVACLVGILAFAMLTWYPTHLVRHYEVAQTMAGYAFGGIGLAVTPVAVYAGPALMKWFNGGRRHDGYVWVGIISLVLMAPLMVASMMASTVTTSLVFAAPAFLLMLTIGNLGTVIMPMLPPAAMRGQVVAVYMFVAALAGLGLGPVVVALVSERLFPGANGLGQAMMGVVCLVAPIALAVLFLARKSFAKSMQAAEEEERASLEDIARQSA